MQNSKKIVFLIISLPADWKQARLQFLIILFELLIIQTHFGDNLQKQRCESYQFMELKDYTGVFHIHTIMSDGTGNIFDVVEAGHRAGVDFMVITDHNSVSYRTEGFDGWYGKLLVLVGQEITPKLNHLVAMGLDELVEMENHYDIQSHIRKVSELGGLGIAVHPHHHPHYRRSFWKFIAAPWENWNRPEIGGVELWSYMADWVHPINYFNPFSMIYYIKRPDRAIEGPSISVINEWDAITQKRRMPALGGVDAHARKDPLGMFCVFPYEFMFKTIRTHIIAPEFTGVLKEDEKIVLEAFREGHCYISYDWLQNARGFTLECSSANKTWIMGDELEFSMGLELSATLPVRTHIKLIRNGKAILRKERERLEFRVEEPGVYRVEARINGRPWLYSNPIYIR